MTDRLVEIAKDLGACWRQITELQELRLQRPEKGSLADGRRLNRLKRDEQCLAERTYVLEAVTTQLRAPSLPAAIVQVVMAHRFVRELMESDLDERQRQATCRSVERLLYSIVECLEATANAPRETMFGTAYMPRDQDPIRSLPPTDRSRCGQAEAPEPPSPPVRGRPPGRTPARRGATAP